MCASKGGATSVNSARPCGGGRALGAGASRPWEERHMRPSPLPRSVQHVALEMMMRAYEREQHKAGRPGTDQVHEQSVTIKHRFIQEHEERETVGRTRSEQNTEVLQIISNKYLPPFTLQGPEQFLKIQQKNCLKFHHLLLYSESFFFFICFTVVLTGLCPIPEQKMMMCSGP